MTSEQTFEVPITADVLGHAHNIIILKEDVVEFGAMVEISATCIAVYMKYLNECLGKLNLHKEYKFVDPCLLAVQCGISKNARSRFLKDVWEGFHQGQLFFVLYNSSGLKMLGLKKRKLPQWIEINCPKQPTNVECGFYIMRYIKDIIKAKMAIISPKFIEKEEYTEEDIDQIQEESAEFVHSYIF